jgi:PII-like signaling protein
LAQSYVVIEIYTSEGARSDGKTLSEAVLEYVRKLKAPARLVVFKGTEGCYENGEVSTQKIVDLSANLPVKMEIVLPSAEADAIMADLQEMVSDGILGSRPLTVFSHRTQKRLFPPQTRVRDVMTHEPVSVSLDEPADQVMKALLSASLQACRWWMPKTGPWGLSPRATSSIAPACPYDWRSWHNRTLNG